MNRIMAASRKRLSELPAWKALMTNLGDHQLNLKDLCAADSKRGERMTAKAAGLYLDYSKNLFSDETLRLLLQLAGETGLSERIGAMFRRGRINITGYRAVLHMALHAPRGASMIVDGENVVPVVHAVLDKMALFADQVQSGSGKGHSGKPMKFCPRAFRCGWHPTRFSRATGLPPQSLPSG